MTPSPRRSPAVAAGLVLACAPACMTPEEYRREADEEVYRLIAERGADLIEGVEEFTIEPPADGLRARILAGGVSAIEGLTLAESLRLAAENSRAYQARKERLYLAALDLTLERWRFKIQEGGSIAAELSGTGSDAEAASGSFFGSLGRLLGSGAQLLGNVGLSVARNLSGSDDWTTFTDVGLDITQPLLRGAGSSVVMEPLTQAERDLVYEVRAFERFRRTFAVEVARQVYRLLQQYDAVDNEVANGESLVLLREKNEALAEAGRLSEIQVDQARQNELRSSDTLLAARRRLEDQLDDFKLFLGLPSDFELTLDRSLLGEVALGDTDELPPEEDAVAAALRHRLDLLTAREQVEDAQRRILVAADALEAGLDLGLEIDLASDANQPLDFDLGDARWSLSALFDLPIDRLPERNAYRASIVAAEVALRNAQELRDTIVADLRAEVRALTSARQSYDIQLNAVALAERRVESARLNLDAGRAETRDLLEAQDSLVSAQNAATRALIDYTLAELELYRDMEALRVVDRGIVTGLPESGEEVES